MPHSPQKPDEIETLVTLENQRVGFCIKSLRESAGLTQFALSKKAAISRASIANIESGRHMLTMRQLCSIAYGLGITIRELLD